MGCKAKDSRAEHKMSVVKRLKQALHQDICESDVGELSSGLEALEPSELHSFHAVVLEYEKAATYLVRGKSSHAIICC